MRNNASQLEESQVMTCVAKTKADITQLHDLGAQGRGRGAARRGAVRKTQRKRRADHRQRRRRAEPDRAGGGVMRYLSVCSGIEAASVAWHPLGWEPFAFAEIEKFPSAVLAHHYPSVPNFGDMTQFRDWPDAAIDVLVGGPPCQSFSVAGLRVGLADPRGNLCLTFLAIGLTGDIVPSGFSGRMSPASCRVTEDGILVPSSGDWGSSGMGGVTGFSMRNMSEWTAMSGPSRSDDGVCSLSDILETTAVPPRYYLSAKACRGILRRAAKRGKELPGQLRKALETVAMQTEPKSSTD